MKVLLIDHDAVALAFAWRCVKAGHAVRWFIKPKESNSQAVGEGFKGLEKVDNWVSSVKWADLIWCSSNDDYLPKLDALRKNGVKVFAPSAQSAALEIKRAVGMKFFEHHEIAVPQYKQFDSLADAEAHVRKSEKRYVFKTLGDNEDKSLSYVSKTPADMIARLQRWQKLKMNPKGPVMLQEFIPGIEFAVSGWMGTDGFLKYFNENFEFKKLLSGDCGPNCYSADTEVLTERGWQFWPDITQDDRIATLVNGSLQFETPTRLIVQDYDGELIGWQSPYLDILVTPDHSMYVQDDHSRKPFWFETARESVENNRRVLRGGADWNGEDDPSQLPRFYTGDFSAWCALIGAYIADGYSRNRSIVFGNCPAHKEAIFTELARLSGFSAKMYGKDLYVNSGPLAAYCRGLGLANEKRVPEYIKSASKKSIGAFLHGYGSGDGTRQPANYLVYTTISKGLADDLQELALKMGWAAGIVARDRRDESHWIGDELCVNRNIAFDVGVSRERMRAEFTPEMSYRKPYTGKVYCCTVSSHIIYVRRNGKPCWLGQCGESGTIMKYVQTSALAEAVLAPLEGALLALGHLGDVDINCIIDEKGNAWPLEFTCRPGWPAFNIMLAEHKGDPVQWIWDACNGMDTLDVSLQVACGLVVTIPDYPYSNKTKAERSDIPIYGVTDKNKPYIAPQSVKLAKQPTMKAGKVVEEDIWTTADDYVAVVTGLGKTVTQACERAYETVKQLHIPDMMYRDDIGERLEKNLPKLHAQGYATEFRYS